jgi:hypothetical protein
VNKEEERIENKRSASKGAPKTKVAAHSQTRHTKHFDPNANAP